MNLSIILTPGGLFVARPDQVASTEREAEDISRGVDVGPMRIAALQRALCGAAEKLHTITPAGKC